MLAPKAEGWWTWRGSVAPSGLTGAAEVTGGACGSGFPSSAGAVVLTSSSLGFVYPSLLLLLWRDREYEK